METTAFQQPGTAAYSGDVELATLAEARQVAYRLFAQALQTPDAAAFAALGPVLQALRADTDAFQDFVFFPAWRAFLQRLERAGESNLNELAASYVRLFHVSKTGPPVPPFEGMIVSASGADDAQIQTQLELTYQAAGLEVASGGDRRADHVAVELEFLAFLCLQESKSWRAGGTHQAIRTMKRQRRFLAGHLGAWLPEFGRRLQALAPGGFYDESVSAVRAFVAHDLDMLGALLETLEPAEPAGVAPDG